ncbi:interleukin-1 family member 10-like isoform X3 [Paroedura picta]|uniref:interleukin-1 family member 10-like isoform X3 n=1 Tax=Paroedura picta TaxID=143630 RepID=UPI0040566E35
MLLEEHKKRVSRKSWQLEHAEEEASPADRRIPGSLQTTPDVHDAQKQSQEMSESGIQDLTPSMKPFADAPQGIEPRHYYLRDVDQKSIYLQDKNLVAAPLQGDNSAQEEILSVLPNRFLNRQKIPLILGVKGGSQGISCGKEEKPKLQLEDANLMDLFTNDEEAKRFTFFKLYNGSTNKFESATFPGWYLCSPVEAHKPLGVTSQPGENALIDFYFHQN